MIVRHPNEVSKKYPAIYMVNNANDQPEIPGHFDPTGPKPYFLDTVFLLEIPRVHDNS